MKRVEDVIKDVKAITRSVRPRTPAEQLAQVQEFYGALANDLRLINASILAHTQQFIQFRQQYEIAIASQKESDPAKRKQLPSLSAAFGSLKGVMNTVERDLRTVDQLEGLKNKLPYFSTLFEAMKKLRAGLVYMADQFNRHETAANFASAAAFFAEFSAMVYTPLKLTISVHDQFLNSMKVAEEIRAHIEIPLETVMAEGESQFT